MSFCANCGAPVEGKFCAKCGSPVLSGAPPAAAGPMPPPPPTGAVPPGAPPPAFATTGGMSDNAASAVCYVLGFITGIIFLVIPPYNQNKAVRFHAFQSIFLSVALILIRIVLSIVFSAMHLFEFFFLWSLVSLALLAIWLFMIIATYQGKTIVLPIIGPLAQQQA